jgi:hypothetical protein
VERIVVTIEVRLVVRLVATAAVLAVLATAGCGYQASFADCQVRCTTSCPDDLVCSAEGYCRPPGAVPSCDAVIGDAGLGDASPGDAAPGGRVEVLQIRATPDRDLDLLFVVDDSTSRPS